MKVTWPCNVSGWKGLIKLREGWAGNTGGCWFHSQWWNDGSNALIRSLSGGGGQDIWLDPGEMKPSGWLTCPYFYWAALRAANQRHIIEGWISARNAVKKDSFRYFVCRVEVTVWFNTCSHPAPHLSIRDRSGCRSSGSRDGTGRIITDNQIILNRKLIMHVKFKGLKCGGRLCDIHLKCLFHWTFRISMQSDSLFVAPLVVNIEYKT